MLKRKPRSSCAPQQVMHSGTSPSLGFSWKDRNLCFYILVSKSRKIHSSKNSCSFWRSLHYQCLLLYCKLQVHLGHFHLICSYSWVDLQPFRGMMLLQFILRSALRSCSGLKITHFLEEVTFKLHQKAKTAVPSVRKWEMINSYPRSRLANCDAWNSESSAEIKLLEESNHSKTS